MIIFSVKIKQLQKKSKKWHKRQYFKAIYLISTEKYCIFVSIFAQLSRCR